MQNVFHLTGSRTQRMVALIFLALVFSCAEKIIEPPKNLIPKDQLTNVLYDLAILNAVQSTNKSALSKNSVEIMPYLFEKHSIDSVQFVESDLYYASVPLEYESIYKEIESRLKARAKKIQDLRKLKSENARERARAKRDSLRNNAEKAKTLPAEK